MKKTTFVALVTAFMLSSGCSYSASQSSESSFSANSDGKVDISASSSVYTEKVENGKTTNNSASVAVNNKGASVNTEKSTSTHSDEGLTYTAVDADLRKGEAEIDGYFVNNGKNPVTIKEAHITLTFKDDKGKVIWQDETVINNLNLTVKPGEKAESNFVVTNPNAPAYSGSFDLDYHIEYS